MTANPAIIASRPHPQQTLRPRPPHLDYASFWTTEEHPGWLDRVRDQAATWLRNKQGLDLDLSVDGETHTTDLSRRVQVLHRTASKYRGIRLRVWNRNGNNTFIVTVLAVEGSRHGWLQLTVTSTDPFALVEKPNIADQFIDVVEFADVTLLRSQAEYTSVDGLDALEALIGAPDRRLPVIVAAPLDDAPFDTWNRLVDQWTRKTVGIAHVASLAPRAAQEFRERHHDLAVLPGTLRTYPSGADLTDPATARMARWLSHQKLAGSNKNVAKSIERFVRQHAAAQPMPLPSAARDWSRAFDRIASGKLRAAVSPAQLPLSERRELLATRRRELLEARPVPANQPNVPTIVETPRAEAQARPSTSTQEIEQLRRELAESGRALKTAIQKLHDVQETLMLDDLEEESLNDLLDQATRDIPDQSAIDELLESNESLQSRIETLEEDALAERTEKAEARNELRRLEEEHGRALRETEYLRAQVLQSDPEAAYAFTDQGAPRNPLGECPATWELLASSRDLAKHDIVLTAPEKKIAQLESIDADGAALTAAWDALGTLVAYKEAVQKGSWNKGVHDYCESGPISQFHVPPNKHSRGETSATKQDTRYRKARLLPVPTSVKKEGAVHMWAHFKPYTWAQDKRLRIHYYDQVSTDGKIYIGHIGEHLPSASTDKVHR